MESSVLDCPRDFGLDLAAAPPRTLRVMHVINGEHYAGAERVQDLLAARLPALGYDVHFTALKAGKFATARKTTAAPLYTLPMRGRFDLRPAFRLAKILRQERIALIHTHTPRAALIGRVAARLTGLPMVHHVHSPTIADTTQRVRRWVNGLSERISMQGLAGLITVSHTLRQYVAQRGLRAGLIQVVHNGVPVLGPLTKREVPTGDWTLGTVALFRPRKGLEVLLHALANLRQQGLPVRLRAVGQFETPDYERTIHALAGELQVNDAIDWTGFCSDVPAELARMDLFVLPSLFGEGLPMVVLEAMAAGVPVVATRVEGIPEAVRDRVDGLIAEPNNVASLTAQLACVVRGEVSWQELRRTAHARQADEFSDTAMAAGIATIYDQLLRSGTSR